MSHDQQAEDCVLVTGGGHCLLFQVSARYVCEVWGEEETAAESERAGDDIGHSLHYLERCKAADTILDQ